MDGLLNLRLTREEEDEISITTRCRSDLLEECNLSLFGRLLSDRHQNQRALKTILRSAWKMGSDLQIVDVGNNILQFKFSSEYQLQWVEKNGPWNFDNNLLLLCRWRRGLTSTNITFTHSPFWVQIWGLPFELMAEEVCKELGNSLGSFIETDRRSGQSEQAKFMRVRVNLQLDKPLRRGGKIASMEGEKFWVSFRYERLPTFCFHCGRLGHDLKHCNEISNSQDSSNQYGDWLRAQGSFKTNFDRSRSISSGGKDDSNEDKVEELSPSTVKNSAMDDGGSTSNADGNRTEKFQNLGKANEPEKAIHGWDNSARLEQVPMQVAGARDATGSPTRCLQQRFKIELKAADAVSPVGQSTQTEAVSLVSQPAQNAKDPMDVSSPLKTSTNTEQGNTTQLDSSGPAAEKKTKAKVHIKKIAREYHRNKSPQLDKELLSVGKKRGRKLIFDEEEEVIMQKKRCTEAHTNQTVSEERSAVAAMQRRREP